MKTWLILLCLAIMTISSLQQVASRGETVAERTEEPTVVKCQDETRWQRFLSWVLIWKTPCVKEEIDNRNDITPTPLQDAERSEEIEQTQYSDTGTNFESDGQLGTGNLDHQETSDNIAQGPIHKENGKVIIDYPDVEFSNGQKESAEVSTEGPTTANTTPIPTVSDTSCPPNSCSQRWKPWPTCAQSTLEDEQKLAEALSRFSLEFYKIAVQKNDGNMVFSPLSIITTLSNLLLGACDETKDRLENLLFYPKDFACVHRALKVLGKSEALTSANAIFYQPALKMSSGFQNLTSTFYQTKLKFLSNNTNQAVTDVNSWVSEHTDNKIKKLLDDLDSDAQMVLLNAVYFHSKWKTIFRKKNTIQEEFHRPGLPSIKVPMMTSKKYPVASYFDYNLQAKVGRFQLQHNLSLVILIPRSQFTNLAEIEERLTATTVMSALNRVEELPLKPTIVTLPKFKLESSQDLTKIIGEMDFGLFYDADLCGIAQNESIALSSAKHKAVLQVSEEGVEGAAATAVSLARTATMFEVQQPFIFLFLRDHRVPVFLGRVTNPLTS
ncbi:plasma protease C1 inhibitor isoform X2 [Notechis scutatus]|uniref:Plasma protease C1 inhibitor isoform X2 n=1 Tax=Notechis scutatus TaxID=8663 RepID=A0A6J1VHX0_9SAUR|nr:plasma protease C1 inhibitor isoform X2 [Notechis scutatus]